MKKTSRDIYIFAMLGMLITLILAACLNGAEIQGPNEVAVGEPAWFSIVDVEGDVSATFFPSALLDTNPKHIVPGSGLFRATEPGTYQILGMAVNWGTKQLIPLVRSVTVTGEMPNPDPEPDPTPGPVAKLLVLVIEEASDRSPEQYRVLSSPTWRSWLINNGHRFLVVDQDVRDEEGNVPTGLAPFITQYRGGSEPCLVFFIDDETDELIAAPIPLPGTSEAHLGKIKEHVK